MADSVQELKQALNITGDAMVEKSDGSVRLVGSKCSACGDWIFPPHTFINPNANLRKNTSRFFINRTSSCKPWQEARESRAR